MALYSSNLSLFARTRLGIEGLFWLTRPQTLFSKLPFCLAAWFIGTVSMVQETRAVFVVMIFVASYQALLFVINDLLDAARDKISAPHMPIPSGLVSSNAAAVFAFLLGVTFFIMLYMLAEDVTGVLISLASMPFALLTMKVYSRTKSAWFSPILASTSGSSITLWIWLLVGREQFTLFAVLFVITALHSFHTNLRAQVRDVVGDSEAGNRTLAVRIGTRKLLLCTIIVRTLELVLIAVLGLLAGATVGFFWLLLAVCSFAYALLRGPSWSAGHQSRIAQTALLQPWVYASFLSEIATLGTLSPIVGGAVAIGMFIWYQTLRPLYHVRIESGQAYTEMYGHQ